MKKFLENLQHAALLLSILTPCLLTAGYSYHLGTITAFGLDSSLVERGFGEVITESWIVGITFIVFFAGKFWYPFYFVLFIFAFMVYCVFAVTKRQEQGLTIPFIDDSLSKENPGRKFFGIKAWGWYCIFSEIPNLIYIVAWPVGLLAIALFFSIKPYKDANKGNRPTNHTYRPI